MEMNREGERREETRQKEGRVTTSIVGNSE